MLSLRLIVSATMLPVLVQVRHRPAVRIGAPQSAHSCHSTRGARGGTCGGSVLPGAYLGWRRNLSLATCTLLALSMIASDAAGLL